MLLFLFCAVIRSAGLRAAVEGGDGRYIPETDGGGEEHEGEGELQGTVSINSLQACSLREGGHGMCLSYGSCVSPSQLGVVEESMKQWREKFNSVV